MFRKGVIHGIIVLLAAIVSVIVASLIENEDISELLIGLTVIVGWLVVGYMYKKNIGPLIFSEDGKAVNRLIKYIFGVGMVWGPAKLFLADFPVPDVNPIFNIALALLSIPMAGMSVFGALLIGGMFYRVKS
jgi:hypothetical protein